MDIGIDQGYRDSQTYAGSTGMSQELRSVRHIPLQKEVNDLYMSDDGRYYYNSQVYDRSHPAYQLPIDRFSRDRHQYKTKRDYRKEEQLLEKYTDIYRTPANAAHYMHHKSFDIMHHLSHMKDSIYGLFNDTYIYGPSIEIFTNGDRLFYTGILLLICAFLLTLCCALFIGWGCTSTGACPRGNDYDPSNQNIIINIPRDSMPNNNNNNNLITTS